MLRVPQEPTLNQRFGILVHQVLERYHQSAGDSLQELLVLLEGVYSVTDPPIKALRRVVPPLRLGNFALDLSFILVMISAYLLRYVNRIVLLS